LGLPVRSYEHFDQLPNKSELLLASLLYAREDEVISGLLPIYIHKYFDDLDWHKVIRKAKDLRLLGYVIHLAMHCSGESKYNWLLLQIKRKLGAFEQENLNLIMENTEFYEKRCASVNNIVADSWLLNTTDELGILKQKFNRFF